ncbi:hypothetical protein NUW58_g1692 [Xylaria curta]|uniref:Uncharacterized protein n=1 Tax=Xylaria curta TaxID=42375 RepID=A0ACC1PJ02_9PEZI|nr:hypothetical protein NUW58_g1692 [Xylaria curta]
MKLLFILPASLTGLILAQAIPPSVYVLMPNSPILTALSSVFNTLGYSHSELAISVSSNAALEVDQRPLTYTILAPGAAYKNISRADPSAKFILPITRSTVSSWFGLLQTQIGQELQSDEYTDSIRAFFADKTSSDGKPRLFELDVFPAESHTQAETWVALCDFLGLGYSIVERLKLWQFPG